MSDFPTPKELPIDLGNDLILRRSTIADTEKLVKFNAIMHKDLLKYRRNGGTM